MRCMKRLGLPRGAHCKSMYISVRCATKLARVWIERSKPMYITVDNATVEGVRVMDVSTWAFYNYQTVAIVA